MIAQNPPAWAAVGFLRVSARSLGLKGECLDTYLHVP